jgi:ribosome maturation factor RimP
MDAETLIRPVVEDAGLELVEVVRRRDGRRRVLHVTVDRDAPLDLDTIAEVSERLARRLDAEDVEIGPYALEVSSPGIERPLRGVAQFRRALGSSVKVKTKAPIDGARIHEGPLVEADEEAIAVSVAGVERRIPLVDVASARTVVDWDAELRSSPRRNGP